MSSSCSNCHSDKTEELRRVSPETTKFAPMSDGNLVKNFEAAQIFCHNCGCVFTEYYPSDRLQTYFKEEYDVSDTVQNCQVVIEGKKSAKHSLIHQYLLDECSSVGPEGSMLEIACGEGDLTRKFADNHQGWKCIGLDPSLSANLVSEQENVSFVRDFFSPEIFNDQKFDVVVAHGILNRVPTLEMLEGITKIANEGALISVEIVTLENSMYAPFIWDHSYTYLKNRFISYLKSFGIVPQKEYDCGSTIQFVCHYDSSLRDLSLQKASKEESQSTLAQYQKHVETWDNIKNNFSKEASEIKDGKIAIFGAGLYSAVLYHLIDDSKIDYIVDEFRAGSQFDGHQVLDFEAKLDEKSTHFLLCCRERNIDYLKDKISNLGFSVKSLQS